MELLAKAEVVVMDKTGTLTKGVFEVTDIEPADGVKKDTLLEIATVAESYSSHPISKSLIKAYGKEIPYTIQERRAGDIATCYSDPSKALNELGWKAERGIEEMCEDSWRWQSQNPNGYPD